MKIPCIAILIHTGEPIDSLVNTPPDAGLTIFLYLKSLIVDKYMLAMTKNKLISTETVFCI